MNCLWQNSFFYQMMTIHLYFPHYPSSRPQWMALCIPPDLILTVLEGVTAIIHYCLLDPSSQYHQVRTLVSHAALPSRQTCHICIDLMLMSLIYTSIDLLHCMHALWWLIPPYIFSETYVCLFFYITLCILYMSMYFTLSQDLRVLTVPNGSLHTACTVITFCCLKIKPKEEMFSYRSTQPAPHFFFYYRKMFTIKLN